MSNAAHDQRRKIVYRDALGGSLSSELMQRLGYPVYSDELTTSPDWFPSWLTQNYLIDADRYIAAGVNRGKSA